MSKKISFRKRNNIGYQKQSRYTKRMAIYAKAEEERQKRTPCMNCGQPGAHYAPPSFGDDGFFMCESINKLDKERGLHVD